MTTRTKITMAHARAFAPASGREAVLWDSAAPGLGLRVRPNGRKTWIVHRRCNGSVIKRTLGGIDALTVGDARHAALSSMMKHAEALGLRRENSNPCKGLRRRKTGFTAHYLTDGEFAALGRALDDAEADYPVAVAVLRFLLYTGARKSEALRLKWEHVHGDRAVLPDSKTGPRTIWLASPARAVLAARSRRTNCPWVFASHCGGRVKVEKAWNAVRKAAGLDKLRIHDLRHSHAAVAVGGGEGLRVVAGLLGHADIKTTFGYAHLAEDSVFDAANRVSRGLADMLDGGEADHD